MRIQSALPLLTVATLLITGTPAYAASGATARQAHQVEKYVSLGDSAAAGPIIVPQQVGQPLPCLRTERNFPTLVAQAVDASTHVDVTCSSAEIDHLWEAQYDAPPQLDALTADTTLVTLGPIGANDADLVASVLGCLVPGCATRDGSSVHDAIEATRPELRAALKEIERRAPRAEVVVVGYGEYLPAGGCPLIQPLIRKDADYVRGLTHHMSNVLREVANEAGAEFTDLRTIPGAADHTACAPAGQRWLEGLIPVSLDGAVPFHPTALGMDAFADAVGATVLSRAR